MKRTRPTEQDHDDVMFSVDYLQHYKDLMGASTEILQIPIAPCVSTTAHFAISDVRMCSSILRLKLVVNDDISYILAKMDMTSIMKKLPTLKGKLLDTHMGTYRYFLFDGFNIKLYAKWKMDKTPVHRRIYEYGFASNFQTTLYATTTANVSWIDRPNNNIITLPSRTRTVSRPTLGVRDMPMFDRAREAARAIIHNTKMMADILDQLIGYNYCRKV